MPYPPGHVRVPPTAPRLATSWLARALTPLALSWQIVSAPACSTAPSAPAEGPTDHGASSAAAPIESGDVGAGVARGVSSSSPESAPGAAVAAVGEGAADGTRYRVGDFIIYQYTGTFSPEPVFIIERVVVQRGNQLHIEVEAIRGAESRRWLQVLTDTPENQKAERIDELYELRGEQRIRLENRDNRDVYRLYEWTLPSLEGKLEHVERVPVAMSIAGKSFDCSVERSRATVGGRPARFEIATCPDFLWTNGAASVRADADGELHWQRSVVDVGRGEPDPRALLESIVRASGLGEALASRDPVTGIEWARHLSPPGLDGGRARAYCQALGSGWRLPTRKELESLLVQSEAAESPVRAVLPVRLPTEGFLWSGEWVSDDRPGQAWIMNLRNGHIFNGSGRRGRAWCVHARDSGR